MSNLTADDLEPSEIPLPSDEAPSAPTAPGAPPPPRGSRTRNKPLQPDEVIPPGSQATNRGGRPSAEETARRKRDAQEKAEREHAKRIAEQQRRAAAFLEGTVNPNLAMLTKLVLRVPDEMAWVVPVTDDEGQIVTVDDVPQFRYYNGAQLVVLQPQDIAIASMIWPQVKGSVEVPESVKKATKYLVPVAAAGGVIAFGAIYFSRLRQVKRTVDAQADILAMQRRREAEQRGEATE